MAKLTDKQQTFCDEYLIDLNATQAAIRVGYSTKTAKEIGCENLFKPNIRAYIDKAMAEGSKRTGVNADRVLMELAKLGFVNATDIINMNNATIKDDANRDDTVAIASIKVKTVPVEGGGEITEREIKLYDKTRNLELMGKHLGMFKDKLEIDATVNSTAKLDSILGQLEEDE